MVTGRIGDFAGRRPAIIVSSLMLFLISMSFQLITTRWEMAFARVLYGICYGFSIPLPSAMLSELVPSAQRGKCLVLLNFFVTVGKLFGCLLAYICLQDFDNGDWRTMMAYSAIPSLLTFFGSICLLRESPRFLIAKARYEEGYEVLNAMIAINAKDGNTEPMTQEDCKNLVLWSEAINSQKREASVGELMSNEQKAVTIRLWIIWFFESTQYFGQLVIMPFILGKSKGGFASYIITILGEAPSILVSFFIVDIACLGRKNSLTIFFALGCVFHILSFFVTDLPTFSYLTSAARFCMKECFAMLYPFTAEAYPTLLRSIGFGWASGVGRLGAAFGPYLIFAMKDANLYSPFLLFAFSSAVSAISSQTLPFDTLGRTIDDHQVEGVSDLAQVHPEKTTPAAGKSEQEMTLLDKSPNRV